MRDVRCEVCGRLGKRLIQVKYEKANEARGAAYVANWLTKNVTYAEANARMANEPEYTVEATMPTQSNAIERQNLEQKEVRAAPTLPHLSSCPFVPLCCALGHTAGPPCCPFASSLLCRVQKKQFRREESKSAFLISAFDDLSQTSMGDLQFGQLMPRGYKTRLNINKEVWTAEFFKAVDSERHSHLNLSKLVWQATRLAPGAVIMASRALRFELVEELGVLKGVNHDEQLQTLRDSIQKRRTDPPVSILNEFMVLLQVSLDLRLSSHLCPLARRHLPPPRSAAAPRRTALPSPLPLEPPTPPNTAINYCSLEYQDPDRAMQKFGYNFDLLIRWQKSFHILKPIEDENFLRRLIVRLENGCSGVNGNGVVVNKGNLESGLHFKSCTCESYWCAQGCLGSLNGVTYTQGAACAQGVVDMHVCKLLGALWQALCVVCTRVPRRDGLWPHLRLAEEPQPYKNQRGRATSSTPTCAEASEGR